MKRSFRILKRITIIFLGLATLLAIIILFYMRSPKFGKAPSGARLEQMKKSPRYKNGQFENQHLTPTLTEGYSMPGLLYAQLFKKFPRRAPKAELPSIKTDLHTLPSDSNILVWFGHSSYFMQIDGIRFLIDPVFSGNASPIPGSVKAFKGTHTYQVSDMPEIDYLIISHDHYDHLDYETIIALKSKVKTVICGLGVGAHFEYWGYDAGKIIEKDWFDAVQLANGFTITPQPARHFSGRTLKRNTTLWASFILQTPSLTIYIGGDSGYDTHFAEIGKQFPNIDLAILENGQYNIAWHAIHMLPPEVLQAAKDLRARRLFPVHSSKFTLGQHPWDEPLKEVTRLNETEKVPLVTPVIGEIVFLNDPTQQFKQWWKGIE